MINILKLRKIEKEKKLQDKDDSLEQKTEALASEKPVSEENAQRQQNIENIDEKIIAEIAEEINNAPDSPAEDFRSASEVLLSVSQDIELVEGSVEIQEFTSPVEHDATEEVADPWLNEPLTKESAGTSDEPGEEIEAASVEVKEEEIDPAEAFRQALIAEVLRDETMATRAQVEEEEKMSSAKPEAPQVKESTPSAEKAPVINTSGAIKPEEKKQEKPKAGQQQEVKQQDQTRQDLKQQDAKAHEAIVQLVGFNLGKECYGVDIKRIKEINRMTEITRVPRAPEFIEGVINLRGSVIPVINLRKKVKMPPREYDKDTRIIIVELGGKTIGFIVDAVKEVLRIPESVLVPPPTLAVGKNADYITSVAKVEDELVILLDPDKVLSREETKKLEEAEGKKRK
ncbi:MAG TPA: chemotaxis protein CheW [Ignavibacteriales bacterium]|nr:chemotaxis protein CheW [Ignavibacteriales bacterium]